MSLSVVIPVHNAAHSVLKCLRSLQEQTLQPDEILFIENGSTDDTLRILRTVEKQNSNVIVYSFPQANLVNALNFGLEKAAGEFIARMDADDECLPERFEKQVTFLKNNPEVGVLGTAMMCIAGHEDVPDQATITSGALKHEDILYNLRLPYPGSYMLHPTAMFRPESIRGKLYYRHAFRFAEDKDIWLRLSRQCKMANLAEPLVRYTLPGEASSRMRYPFIAFKACVAAWMDDRLNGRLSAELACFQKAQISLVEIFESLDKQELLDFSVAVFGYGFSMGVQQKLMDACFEKVVYHVGKKLALDCLDLAWAFSPYKLEHPRVRLKSNAMARLRNTCEEKHFNGVEGFLPLLRQIQGDDREASPPSGCTTVAALLDAPSGRSPQAEEDGLTILMELLHKRLPRKAEQFSLELHESRLGWLGECIRWIFPYLPTYNLPFWVQARLDSPAPGVPDAERDGISLLMETLFHHHSHTAKSKYDFHTRQGRLAWAGECIRTIYPSLTGHSFPAWQQARFDAPSPCVPNSAQDGISLLMEILFYHYYQKIQPKHNLQTDKGRLIWLGIFIRWVAPTLKGYRHPSWLADFLECPARIYEEGDTITNCQNAVHSSDAWLSRHFDLRFFAERELFRDWFASAKQSWALVRN